MNKNNKQHPHSMKVGFRELRYASESILEFIGKNKDALLKMTFQEAIDKNYVKSHKDLMGFYKIQCMAESFDMFMALADD